MYIDTYTSLEKSSINCTFDGDRLKLSVTAQERALGLYNPVLLNLFFIIAPSRGKYSCGYFYANCTTPMKF